MRLLHILKLTLKNYTNEMPMQGKVFFWVAFIGTLFSLFTFVINAFLGLGLTMVFVSVFTTLACLLTMIYSVKTGDYISSAFTLFHALILIIIPFLWIHNAGSKGPTPYLFIFLIILFGVIMNWGTTVYMFFVQVLSFGLLIGIELNYPHLITGYSSEFVRAMDLFITAIMIGLFLLIIIRQAMREYRSKISELNNVQTNLYDLSMRDELTGVHNRRYIMKRIQDELGVENEDKISIIMLDIDNFKSINDQYGHQIGDEVICGVSLLIHSLIRPNDVIARIGGEEFLVMLHNTGKEDAIRRGESMRKKIERHDWSSENLKVTVSGGVHECSKGDTLGDVLNDVDQHLYHAKASGKNQIVA